MKIKYESIPNYADHITLKRFIAWAKSSCVIDWEGIGYYATQNQMTNKVIRPSDITGIKQIFSMKTGKFTTVNIKKKIDKHFKYVIWFNK